ncbi:MAG: alginate export family protein [Myxococcales bacterium]|nr:alginate export family protein [Myxococcales bacterium]
MKTLVLIGLVMAATVAEPAHAEEAAAADIRAAGLQLTPYGTLFSRYELRRGYAAALPDGAGDDAVRTRARIGVTAAPVQVADGLQVSLRVAAQAAGLWNVGGDTLDHPALSLHEGLMGLHMRATRLEVGRFEMNYGDSLVIGSVDWSPAGRTFDGVRSHTVTGGGVWVDTFATLLSEGWGTAGVGETVGEGDLYFLGVYAALGPALGPDQTLDVYLLSRAATALRAAGSGRDGTADVTLGGRTRQRLGAADLRAEAGLQAGGRVLGDGSEVRSATAYQFDVELGLNAASDRLRVGLEGFRASGDDPDTASVDEGWAQLYPTGHRWLGHMDVIAGRTDVQGGSLHLSGKIADRHTLAADAHAFFFTQSPASGDRYRGAELDAWTSHRLGRGLSLREELGVFLPTSAADDTDPRYFGEVELRLVFPLPDR